MGVAVRARFTRKPPWQLSEIHIKLCVDDPLNPTNWVEVKWDIGRMQLTITGMHGGAREPISLLHPSGFFTKPDTYYDFYACVTNLGAVRAYIKEASSDEPALNWRPIGETSIESVKKYLQGTYFGVFGLGDANRKVYLTSVQALKTYHPGKPEQWKFKVDGIIEIGDKFVVGITVGGNPETYTVAAVTTDKNKVALQIRDALTLLDTNLYPQIRSLVWRLPPDNEKNTFIGEIQGNVTATAATLEANDDPKDEQTFEVIKYQSWEKGAYNCPKCPEICGPCAYCEGSIIEHPDEHFEPDQVRIISEGVQPVGGPGAGLPVEGCMAEGVVNPYVPPVPDMPELDIRGCVDGVD